ncbi:MAG TPA: FAD-dependent oxidoreductase [Blastocatellia bacterium]|nr:FAD-dependent oxidoreductase [Blastocatellia bacterium]
MPLQTHFLVRRIDSDKIVNDVLIDKETLKIGRHIENDVVLNDPGVAPAQALIAERDGRFWLIDLLESHATLLNGRTVSEEAIHDGDVIRIGPYSLHVDRDKNELGLTVKRKLTVFPLKAPITRPVGISKRVPGTAPLALMEDDEQEALRAFWQARRGEAGKIVFSTPLCPSRFHGIGKARFNWRPTLDLRTPNRKACLILSFAIVAALSICAWYACRDVYSPAPLSVAHTSLMMSPSRTALRAISSCSDCHEPAGGMQQHCTGCHNVPANVGVSPGFDPGISKAHRDSNVACVDCHSDHNGPEFHIKDVNNESCKSCHNERYRFNGRILGAPHKSPDGSPTVGYIRKNDTVTWKNLTGRVALDRFHVDHPYGATKCGYCHKGIRGTIEWKQAPQTSCGACHAGSFATGEIVGPNCGTCHSQHGEHKDLAVTIGNITDSERRRLVEQIRVQGLNTLIDSTESFTSAAAGGASVRRQGELPSNWSSVSRLGAIPWYFWAAPIGLFAAGAGCAIYIGNSRRKQSLKNVRRETPTTASTRDSEEGDADAGRLPSYPYPKIDSQCCIGCYACIEACPHDVLAMAFDEVAAPVALTQCMDDAGCQAACPTGACVVVNSQRESRPREMPHRDPATFLTNVPGIYVIGDVSRVPLIKNAVNEGAEVIDRIVEDLREEGPKQGVQYDVAIIGAGAAGLSATLTARQNRLRFITIEQNKVLSTVEAYPAAKNVNFKPDTKRAKGPLADVCCVTTQKETVVENWTRILTDNCVKIHEGETCTGIEKEDHFFKIRTKNSKTGAEPDYTVRRVVIAIGASSTPRKLRVPAARCQNCGEPSNPSDVSCARCNTRIELTEVAWSDKVRSRLSDPGLYAGKKCVAVGGGNSAVETAVQLTGFKRNGDEIKFTLDNEVTLLVRTAYTSDLKFGNKVDLYDCRDAGRIKVLFNTEIMRIEADHVVIMNDRKEESGRIVADCVFVNNGSEWPRSFLKALGIKITQPLGTVDHAASQPSTS